MMAAAAFTQVESALRWFVDNFSIIADWRAALLRVASFRQAVIAHEDRPQFDSHIEYATGDAGALVIDGRSEEHTSELQSLMRISSAVFCLKKKKQNKPK